MKDLGIVLAAVGRRSLLLEAIASQRHYPCKCCDWVWREDGWQLVRRWLNA